MQCHLYAHFLPKYSGIIDHNGDEEQGLINAKFTENENKIEIPLDAFVEMQLQNLDESESSLILNQIAATKLQSTIGLVVLICS